MRNKKKGVNTLFDKIDLWLLKRKKVYYLKDNVKITALAEFGYVPNSDNSCYYKEIKIKNNNAMLITGNKNRKIDLIINHNWYDDALYVKKYICDLRKAKLVYKKKGE